MIIHKWNRRKRPACQPGKIWLVKDFDIFDKFCHTQRSAPEFLPACKGKRKLPLLQLTQKREIQWKPYLHRIRSTSFRLPGCIGGHPGFSSHWLYCLTKNASVSFGTAPKFRWQWKWPHKAKHRWQTAGRLFHFATAHLPSSQMTSDSCRLGRVIKSCSAFAGGFSSYNTA